MENNNGNTVEKLVETEWWWMGDKDNYKIRYLIESR